MLLELLYQQMDLVTQVTLIPTPDQSTKLRSLMETFNKACNYVSQTAFTTKTFFRFELNRLVYKDVRRDYSLSSTAAQLVVKKVATSYKIFKKQEKTYITRLALYPTKLAEWEKLSTEEQASERKPRKPRPPKIRNFKILGGIPLDRTVLTYKKNTVTIRVMDGRIELGYKTRNGVNPISKKSATLLFRNGRFLLHQCIDVAEAPIKPVQDFLGVDLGIKNIAYDSDGAGFAGAHLNNMRLRHNRLRSKLQRKGTKSAKKLLKKRSKREARFARDVNHQISKKLVLKVRDSNRGLAIENLKGIRKVAEKSSKTSKTQRVKINSWSFFQLRSFLDYKSKLYGVGLRVVDPSYTSVTCPQCGCRNKKNRLTRDRFKCVICDHTGYSDFIAAVNIRAKALVVNSGVASFQPNASDSHSLGANDGTAIT
jgi:putative transposase